MSGGLVALSGMQRVIETTPGTALACTAIQPLLGGWLKENVERHTPDEQRYSFINGYRNFAVRNNVELSGITIAPTFRDLSWWGCLFWKGLGAGGPPKVSTGVVRDVSAYDYTFTPTIASDDLQTATLEVGDDVQHYQVPYVLGNKITLGWAVNGDLSVSMDLLGQKATAATKTPALAVLGDEQINGALTTVTIDSSTIGTTAITTAQSMNVSWDNGWAQEWVLNGLLTPLGAHRGATKKIAIDATLLFNSSTEYNTFYQSYNIATPRKIRISTLGTLAGSATAFRELRVDLYTIWDDASFSEVNGQHAVQFTGHAQYDSTATHDQQVRVTTASATTA
jgi:hypothetical protein